MLQKTKTAKQDQDTQNILKYLESRNRSLSYLYKNITKERQHKKSCAQQNVSFMKQIRDYKLPSKLKAWVK